MRTFGTVLCVAWAAWSVSWQVWTAPDLYRLIAGALAPPQVSMQVVNRCAKSDRLRPSPPRTEMLASVLTREP